MTFERPEQLEKPEQAPEQEDREPAKPEGTDVELSPERRKIMEQYSEERSGKLSKFMTSEIVSNGLNLVPFAGGSKMVIESISGRELSGHELQGKDRLIHAGVGVASLGLDFTGVGEVGKAAVVGGKAVIAAEKLAARLAAKGATRSARVFAKTAKFMAKHPKATRRAEEYADKRIRESAQLIKQYRAGERAA